MVSIGHNELNVFDIYEVDNPNVKAVAVNLPSEDFHILVQTWRINPL